MTATTDTTDVTGGDDRAPADPGAIRGALVPLLFGFFPTQVLHVAATLRLADRLADGPRTVEYLAADTGTDAPSLARVLRALACFEVLDRVGDDTFALGPHGPGLLTDGPASIRHLVLLFGGDGVWRSWGELGESVRTGEPAWDRITGASSFEYMARNPQMQADFNRAMAEGTRNAAPGVAAAGGFDRFAWVADVGGGDGTLLAAVLQAHRHLRGTVVDTPTGLAQAPGVLAAAGVADRADAVEGDFFEAVPSGPDAYLVKSVIHDWDDERATAVLRTIRDALGPGGTVLVVEPVVPEVPAAAPDVLMMVMSDLNMLVCTGGKERTEAEFRALLAAAGLELRSVTPVPGPTNFSVIEAVAAP